MKTRLALFLSLFSIYTVAQSQHVSVMRNMGGMFVGGNAADALGVNVVNSSIYIDGTSIFGTGSAVATKPLSVMTLTGDLVSDVDNNAAEQHIFTTYNKDAGDNAKPILGAQGYMLFTNPMGAKVNVPTLANPSGQAFDLNLTKKQTVKMASTQKDLHYLSLPIIYGVSTKSKLGVDSLGSYIAFDPGVAIASNEVKPSVMGVVSIEGKYTSNRKLDIAYVKGALLPNAGGNAGADISTWQNVSGSVVRDIKLYDAAAVGAGGNSNLLVDNGAKDRTYTLTGFTPTSRYLYSDHMFFNVLTRPQQGSFTGNVGPITDPRYEMKAGYGYFIAQNAIPLNDPIYADIINRHSVAPEERAVGGYIMGGREIFLNKITGNTGKEKFNRFAKNGTMFSTAARPYIGETLGGASQKYEDLLKSSYGGAIKVDLMQGFNFLGNPFTTPLDLSDFATVDAGVVGNLPADWGTWADGKQYTISPDKNADIRGTFWVVNNATIRYYEKDGAQYFGYNANYWDAQKQGGTIDLAVSGNYNVGPMQMFALQTSKGLILTLPVSKTTMANVKTTRATEERADELLLQAVVLGQNDKDQTEDRLAIVLKENGSMLFIDPFDSRKLITNTQENKGGSGTVLKNAAGDDVQPYSGIIYTKSAEGTPLSTNVLPSTLQQLAMYFEPTQTERRVRIKPYRLETWNKIEKAWLEDKFTNTIVELTPDMEYVFTSKPLSADMAKENRFVLYFNQEPGNTIENPAQTDSISITTYYQNSVLYLDRLTEADTNSKLQIYDLQGRLMGQTTITSTPAMQYPKSLVQGTYILKVSGKRNYTTKFIAF